LTFGFRPTNEVEKSLHVVLKFSVLENRSDNWKQLCPLPENTVAVFNSSTGLFETEKSLVELAKINVSALLNPSEGGAFVVDVMDQINLFSQFVNQLNSTSFKVGISEC
jgi:hypothetical protein